MTKKILFIILSVFVLLSFLQIKTYATSIPLNSVNVTLSKEKIAPGEEVTVTVEFGEELGAYTFDIAYDNNIFEYISTDGGTENDDGTRVRVTYYDSSGGTNPRENMSVTFKAKENLITTNPTNFSITAEGLANSDASQEYDDIIQAIEKEITVEPQYVNYDISLEYNDKIIENKEKEIKIITSSSLGKNYDNVMLQVEVLNKPENANVMLTAIDENSQKIDILKDGYGKDKGYSLGGKDVRHELNITGIFDILGDYKIKFSILDKDNSNTVIAEKEIDINVTSEEMINEEIPEEPEEQEKPIENVQEPSNNENTEQEDLPKELPKTGMTQYGYIAVSLIVLITVYIVTKNYKKEK